MSEDHPAAASRRDDGTRNSSHSNPAAIAAAKMQEPVSQLAYFCAGMSSSSVNSFCGAMAGVASGVVTCPLDVIKTRLQGQGSFRRQLRAGGPPTVVYKGLIGTASTIWQQDGLRGMYRGLGTMLVGYPPTWAVYMTVYDASRSYYYENIENKWLARVCSSVTAGACSTIATNPIWVIKTRLMSQVGLHAPEETRPPWHYNGTIDAARKMLKAEGLAVFYSGLGPALLGLSHVAIQFPLYEYLKLQFTGQAMGENAPDAESKHYILGISAATFISKVTATSATYPHEVLRTRLQTQQRSSPSHSHDHVSFRGGLGNLNMSRGPGTASSDGMINLPRYRGMARTFQAILAEEGWRAFYHGMGTNLLRAVPAAMTTMLTYESLKTLIHKLQIEGGVNEHDAV